MAGITVSDVVTVGMVAVMTVGYHDDKPTKAIFNFPCVSISSHVISLNFVDSLGAMTAKAAEWLVFVVVSW